MIFLLTIFEMNFVEVWQSSHNCRFLTIWSGVPGSVLMSPNAMASFSLWWHKWITFSSSSTLCSNKFCRAHILHHGSGLTISSVLRRFWSLRVDLIIYYKCMHHIIHFNPGTTWLFLHISFLFLSFNILTEFQVASGSLQIW
jgi:hypothetical protein